MAGTLSKDMRDMPQLCVPIARFIGVTDRIFSANKNRAGESVYNHAGIEGMIGLSNKRVVYADYKHRSRGGPGYVPTRTADSFVKAEIVNEATFVEASVPIGPGLDYFLRQGDDRDAIMMLAQNPTGRNMVLDLRIMDRRGNHWHLHAIRWSPGPAPYILLRLDDADDLEHFMNGLFNLDEMEPATDLVPVVDLFPDEA